MEYSGGPGGPGGGGSRRRESIVREMKEEKMRVYFDKVEERAALLKKAGFEQPWAGPYKNAKIQSSIKFDAGMIILLAVILALWIFGIVFFIIVTPAGFKKFNFCPVLPTNWKREMPTYTNTVYTHSELPIKYKQLESDYKSLLTLVEIPTLKTELHQSIFFFDIDAQLWKETRKKEKAILILGNLNGPSYNAPTAAMQIVRFLIDSCRAQYEILQTYEIYIIPNANPDTYKVSHEAIRSLGNPSENLKDSYISYSYRNQHKPPGNTEPNTSYGLNNFGSHFAEKTRLFPDSAGDTEFTEFPGFYAFSEVETQAIKHVLTLITEQRKQKLLMVIQLEEIPEHVDEVSAYIDHKTSSFIQSKLLNHIVTSSIKHTDQITGSMYKYSLRYYHYPGHFVEYVKSVLNCQFVFKIENTFWVFLNDKTRLPPYYSIFKFVTLSIELMKNVEEYLSSPYAV